MLWAYSVRVYAYSWISVIKSPPYSKRRVKSGRTAFLLHSSGIYMEEPRGALNASIYVVARNLIP
jgi:hypothetical protein